MLYSNMYHGMCVVMVECCSTGTSFLIVSLCVCAFFLLLLKLTLEVFVILHPEFAFFPLFHRNISG